MAGPEITAKGRKKTLSLVLKGLCLVLALFLFLGVWSANLGWVGWLTWGLVAGLLLWQHSLVKPDDLKKVNLAFFTLNALIAAIVMIGLITALFVSAGPIA